MTNQNVVLSDTKSGINLSITVHVNDSTIFTAAQKPPATPGGYISISRKKLLKNLEISGGARINAWVDSMRASSPTHLKSNTSLEVEEDQSAWNVSIISILTLHSLTLELTSLPTTFLAFLQPLIV